MSRPANSIANIKLPGENTQRPIVPYAVSVSTNETAQAVLPAISNDEYIVVDSIIASEYISSSGALFPGYNKGDYCKHNGFLYRAKATTSGV